MADNQSQKAHQESVHAANKDVAASNKDIFQLFVNRDTLLLEIVEGMAALTERACLNEAMYATLLLEYVEDQRNKIQTE